MNIGEMLEYAVREDDIQYAPPVGFTSRAFAEKRGISLTLAKDRLCRLVAVGRLKRTLHRNAYYYQPA